MDEKGIIESTPLPRTRKSLAEDLRALGVTPGMTVVTHTSMKSLGWVAGGAVAVIQALMDAVTEAGTLVMPAHSGDYSDPANWVNPPVPPEWIQIIRDEMPAFDPSCTPTRGIGVVAELFRSFPGVVRSANPAVSFCAWGKHAHDITADHSVDYALGERSPLARVYELDGHILLLGAGYDSNTSMHLAEYRAPGATEISDGAPMMEDGHRIWRVRRDIEIDSDRFPEIGSDLERETSAVRIGKVGSAEARLMRQRAAVDFAVRWLAVYRQAHTN